MHKLLINLSGEMMWKLVHDECCIALHSAYNKQCFSKCKTELLENMGTFPETLVILHDLGFLSSCFIFTWSDKRPLNFDILSKL